MHAGKLRNTILHFYAQTSDHVKRLASTVANGKFSASDAGADTPYKRQEALRTVVKDLRVRLTCSCAGLKAMAALLCCPAC